MGEIGRTLAAWRLKSRQQKAQSPPTRANSTFEEQTGCSLHGVVVEPTIIVTGYMSKKRKVISNPFSTGGGGPHFEAYVQASYLALMMMEGFAPCLPGQSIVKIKLQGKYANYDTDDLILFTNQLGSNQQCKLLGQIKHSISISEKDVVFGEVIQSAWDDFKNPEIFTTGKDVLALITGPLTVDTNDARTILEWARHTENAEEFFTKVQLARFSSKRKRTKLEAFRAQLDKANDGLHVSDEDTFQFIKHFHIINYDLDIDAGATLSLLHSLLSQHSQSNIPALWTQLVDEVQSANKNAGTITKENLSAELQAAFKKQPYETIPSEYAKEDVSNLQLDWNYFEFASELAIANLLGSWNDKYETDLKIISELAKEDYATWISKVREILQQPQTPLILRNGVWTIAKRRELWFSLGARLFDDHLDTFKSCALTVLAERDPKFDLQADERYAASVYGKVLRFSNSLRKGVAESLALLGNQSSVLGKSSVGKPEAIAALTIRDIFEQTDWKLWASLNDLLPLLAEASPGIFLDAVESALKQSPCPFDELFAQEGVGLFGGNYMTGLLWALEALAWDEKYLVQVTVILGELAARDPGGNWMNRPSNSLKTIFLPWMPQTIASIEKRKVALQILQKEVPQIAWKLLIGLLPGQHQMSSGSHKPVWRKTIPENWSKRVTTQEYWEQVSNYAEMIVEIAKIDHIKLNELIGHLDALPLPTFEKFLQYLSSNEIATKPESERLDLWIGLADFAAKHRRYADAKWAIGSELVSKIEDVAKTLAPQNPLNLHRRLFGENDFKLYEEDGDWDEKQKKLGLRRQQAIQEIFDFAGIDAIIEFAELVDAPSKVGAYISSIAGSAEDLKILPAMLKTQSKKLMQFTGGYVWGKYRNQGWTWIDQIDFSKWSHSEITQLLIYLPFSKETWKRVEKLLDKDEAAYWATINANPFEADDELNSAAEKLIENNRPKAALYCIEGMIHKKQPFNKQLAIQALLLALTSNEPSSSNDVYSVVEIIKSLQDDADANPDDILRVEWAYLPLLDGSHGASAKFLENRLAAEPDFFCDVIRSIYRSKNEPKSDKKPTEEHQAIAQNAYHLLYHWKTPPGTQNDGKLSETQFNKWLEFVKVSCEISGHGEVALEHIGQVLIHCAADPDGLWINHAVAAALNHKDADKMRIGFRLGILNSRGVHWIDPTGKPEMELSEQYRKYAEEVENAGYQRFAATLRDLAESYVREAKSVIDEHKQEQEDEGN